MKLVALAQMYNENTYKGVDGKTNLRRYMDSISKYCDALVMFNDGSTDNSRDLVYSYLGVGSLQEIEMPSNPPGENNFANELYHKARALEHCKRLNADWVIRLDCLPGDRCIPVLIYDKIRLMTLNEIFSFYKKEGQQIKTQGVKEFIETPSLYTLSLSKTETPEHSLRKDERGIKLSSFFSSKLTTGGQEVLKKFESGYTGFTARDWSLIKTSRNRLNWLVKNTGTWEKVTKIVRSKHNGDLIRISQTNGEVCTTLNHRVGILDNQKVSFKCAKALSGDRIAHINHIDKQMFESKVILSEWVDLDSMNLFLQNKTIRYKSKKTTQKEKYIQNTISGEDLLAFCELLGFFIAEGSVDTNFYNWRICETSKEVVCKQHAALKRISNHKFNSGFSFDKNKRKPVFHVGVTSGVIPRIFALLCGMGSKNKRVPDFIFNLEDKYKQAFLNGYYLGDGYLTSRNRDSGSSISLKLISGLSLLCALLGREVSITYREPDKFFDDLNHKRAYSIYEYRDRKSIQYNNLNNQTKQIKHDGFVYDLVVPSTHNFVDACGMSIVHNCDEVIEAKGERGGVKAMCEAAPDGVDCFDMLRVNLWRTDRFVRVDELWAKGITVHLWKINEDLTFDTTPGLHQSQTPVGLTKSMPGALKVIHYGFADDASILRKYETYKTYGQSGHALHRMVDESTLRLIEARRAWFSDPAWPHGLDHDVYNTRLRDLI